MARTKNEKNVQHEYSDDDRASPELESLNCCQLRVHRKKIIRERRKHHMDPTYDGPLHKRSCTDIICLLIFIVFLAVWIGLGVYAFKSGTPAEIFAPRDSSNKICGYDPTVTDKPFLIFFDLTKCLLPSAGLFKCDTPEVCVKTCPEENFYYDYYKTAAVAIDFVKQKLICTPEVDVAKINSWEEIDGLMSRKKCAKWYLQSTSVANRCLPDIVNLVSPAGDITIPIDNGAGLLTNQTINGVTADKLEEGTTVVFKALSVAGEFWKAAAQDVIETWPYIVLCLAVGAVLSFVYILLMRWVAKIMVWFSLFACIALFAFAVYMSWTKYDELRKANETTTTETDFRANLVESFKLRMNLPTPTGGPGVRIGPPDGGQIVGDIIKDEIEAQLRNKDTWLVFLIISASILVILLLVIIFLRERIVLAIALINEGSRAVSHAWTTLVLPIFPWIIQIGVLAYGIAIFAYLLTAGVSIYRVVGLETGEEDCRCSNGYKNNDTCTVEEFAQNCKTGGNPCVIAACQFADKESQSFTVVLQLYNLFVFFWSMFFVSAVGQLILASTFATYYWTFHKSDIPLFTVATSAWRVLRYHLGTAAFGSLLLAFVAWLRALLEFADGYLKKYDNAFVKAVKCCLRCFFWCLEKFLKFLNKNAYIMCAVHGSNFCVSAKNAFSLLLRNIIRVAVLDKVTDFLFFISKLVITIAVGVGAFYLFSEPLVKLQDFNTSYQATYSFVPLVFVLVGTYLIASIFFHVYSMAVDTLFLCFLEDSEVNDGSPEKPYFMSKNLMSILGKKNK